MTLAPRPGLVLPTLPQETFDALGNPRRLRLLGLAAPGPITVPEATRVTGWPAYIFAHHLGALKDCGLIAGRIGGVRTQPAALVPIREYFDVALTLTAIHGEL
jgi:hypothetical protein